jgi:hypothetical protein
MPPQQQIDGAFGVGDFGRGEIALAILPGKTARLQQRVAVAQREAQRRRQLQQDVAAARGLAGFDIAQMLIEMPASNARSAWLMARRLRQPRSRSPTGLMGSGACWRESMRRLCEGHGPV